MFRNKINDVKRISKRIKKSLRVSDIDRKIPTKLQPHLKSEPLYDKHEDSAVDTDDDEGVYQEVSNYLESESFKFSTPPVSNTYVSFDSEAELTSNWCSANNSERKLGAELQQYLMETAKLERRCLQTAHETTRTISALRLRSARLDAVEKASRFPADDPALGYTEDEMPAKVYLEKTLIQVTD